MTLIFSLLGVYLVLALKAPSVGRDITGYKRMYDVMRFQQWNDFDVAYFEWGYEFLMMVFAKVFRVSFQQFMACIYAFSTYAYYRFIRRYSKDYTLSVLIYICFTFFTFDMSGIRNALSLAVFLLVFPLAERKSWKANAVYLIVCILAVQLHQSAFVCIPLLILARVSFSGKSIWMYAGVAAAAFALRPILYTWVNLFKNVGEENSISLGGNIILYLLIVVAVYAVWLIERRESGKYFLWKVQHYRDINTQARFVLVGAVVQIFAVGTVLSRFSNYMLVFLIPLIPSIIDRFEERGALILKALCMAFFIWYFYTYSLAPNSLDILPYRFFWS